MSRIGLKPIALPKGVKYTVNDGTVLVEGPKGKVSALVPKGITLKEDNGVLNVVRENDSQKAIHGLARALAVADPCQHIPERIAHRHALSPTSST